MRANLEQYHQVLGHTYSEVSHTADIIKYVYFIVQWPCPGSDYPLTDWGRLERSGGQLIIVNKHRWHGTQADPRVAVLIIEPRIEQT